MKRTISLAVSASICALTVPTVCWAQDAPASPPAEMKISDSDAAAAADAAQAAWVSMDAAKIDSVYASNVVGFDPIAPPLSTDRGNWTKLQRGFADMKFDHVDIPNRTIQVLDDKTFVVSGTASFTSKDGAVKEMAMRFTDVYQKGADGKFMIVNEHVSQVPPPPKP